MAAASVAAAPVKTRHSRPPLNWPVRVMNRPIRAGASAARPLAKPFMMPEAVDMDEPGTRLCRRVQATGIPMVQKATEQESRTAEAYLLSTEAPK